MRQLHFVGFTSDNDGLIVAERRGAKTGGFVIKLDDDLLEQIEQARLEVEARNAPPAPQRPARPRVESGLSPREMQTRLRGGRTVAQVAAEAGVDIEWVERFAAPILAEQALAVTRALEMVVRTPRRGNSDRGLAASVLRNLADRGIRLAEDEFESAWSAFQLADNEWVIRFRYWSRGRDQHAEWLLDTAEGTLFPHNRLGTEMGYVDPGRHRPPVRDLPPVRVRGSARRRRRVKRARAKKSAPPARAPSARKVTAARKTAAAKRAAGSKKTTGVAKRHASKKAVAKKRVAAKRVPTKRTVARKSPSTSKRTASKRVAPTKRATASKRTATKKRAPAVRKAAPARKAASTRKTASRAKAAPARETASSRKAAPARRSTSGQRAPAKRAGRTSKTAASRRSAGARKASAAKRTTTARKAGRTTSKRAGPAKRASVAKKAPARKAAAPAARVPTDGLRRPNRPLQAIRMTAQGPALRPLRAVRVETGRAPNGARQTLRPRSSAVARPAVQFRLGGPGDQAFPGLRG